MSQNVHELTVTGSQKAPTDTPIDA